MKIGLHAGTLDVIPDSVQTTRSSTEAKTVYKVPVTLNLDDSHGSQKKVVVVSTIELSGQTSKTGVARLLVKTSIPWPLVSFDELGNAKVDTSRDVSFHSVLTLPRGATAAVRSGNESYLHGAVAFSTAIVEAIMAPLLVRVANGSDILTPFSVSNDGSGEVTINALPSGEMTWYDHIKNVTYKDPDFGTAVVKTHSVDLVKALATGIAPALPVVGGPGVTKLPAPFFDATP